MQWLLIGYMFLFIHRPFEIWPILGDLHIERVYFGFVMLAWAFYPYKRWLPNVQHMAYLGFALAILFCWALSPWMEQGQVVVENWFKILVFYFLIVTVVHDERMLRQLVLGFLIVMGLYMAHSFKEFVAGRHTYRMGIVRMLGVDLSLGDPNSFGASIVFALPFVTAFWKTSRSRQLRFCLMMYVCLSMGCILLTGSRSSFLGMLAWWMIVIARSRYRWAGLTAALCLSPLIFYALPDSLQNRFETIINPEVGPENARVSGEGRLEGLTKGFDLWMSSPLTGVGPGAWRPATRSKIESHNLYGQLMGETGTLGAMAFLGVIGCFWLNLRWLRRQRQYRPAQVSDFLDQLRRSIGVSLFLLLMMGNFGHNLFRHNWLWYGGFLIIARYCAQTRPVAAPVHLYSARVTWTSAPAGS